MQVVFRARRKFLQLAHRVVREVPHRAGGERRQSRNLRRPMFAEQTPYHLEDASLLFFLLLLSALSAPAALDGDFAAARLHHHVRLRAQEGVAPDALATLDRLQ